MGNLTSQLIISLIDRVSGPAKGAAAALKNVAAAEKSLAGTGKGADGLANALGKASKAAERLKNSGKNMSGWGDGFQREIDKMKLTSSQLSKLSQEYSRFRESLRGTKASVALGAMSDWNKQTLAGLRSVTRAQDDMQRKQSRINGTLRGGARMAAGALGLGGGLYAANRVGRAGINASATSQRESARDYLAGVTPEDSGRFGKAALASSSKYTSVDASTMHERLRDTAMSMRSTDKALELSDTIAQGTVVLQSLKGKDQAIEEGRKFFSALDTLGKNVDPKEVRGLFDGYIKALGVEGADMNLGGVLQMARQSRSAGGSLSNRFMMTTGVGLQRDMGDAQVGTALSSLQSQVIGGRATKQSKAEQQRMGLRDDKGEFLNSKMMMENPDLYAWGPLKDALQKNKVDTTDNTAVSASISKMFSNRVVADIMTKLIQQEDQYRAKQPQYEKAPGLAAGAELSKRDPFVAYEGLNAQLRNLATQAPLMDAAAAGLTKLSSAIGGFVKSYAEDDTAGKVGKGLFAGIAGAGVAGGGLMAAKGAYQWFTGAGALAGSAAALDGSAAALTAAAGVLSGKGALGAVAAGGAGAAAAGSPSMLSRAGGAIKSAAPFAGVLGAAALVPTAILGGGIYGATKLFPDDAESGGKRKSHADTIRQARIESFNSDRERQGVPGIGSAEAAAAAARKTGDAYKAAVPDLSDVWTKGTTGIEHLDQSAEAAAAGSATGEAYKSSVSTALAGVDAQIQAAVSRWTGMLNFSAGPTITPKFGPAPSVGKGAALDAAASKHAAFSDGNGANFGTT
jgi:hypothetical protein